MPKTTYVDANGNVRSAETMGTDEVAANASQNGNGNGSGNGDTQTNGRNDAPPDKSPVEGNNGNGNSSPAPTGGGKLLTSLVPFTPVPLKGPDALYGWGRIGLYGVAAYLTFNRARKLSYGFMAAAGMSALTSFGASSWDKANEKG